MSKKLTSKTRQKPSKKSPAKERSVEKSQGPVDLNWIQNISDFMQANGLVEFDVKTSAAEIRLRRFEGAAVPVAVSPALAPQVSPALQKVEAPKAEKSASAHHIVKSPFVGTFYRSPGPTQDPFVTEGKTVNEGDPLCIIEAMKLMNEIESEVKGRIVRILVKNGTPVEFGEPLFEVELL